MVWKLVVIFAVLVYFDYRTIDDKCTIISESLQAFFVFSFTELRLQVLIKA